MTAMKPLHKLSGSILLSATLFLAILGSGCVSKQQLYEERLRAYREGQRDAIAQMGQQANPQLGQQPNPQSAGQPQARNPGDIQFFGPVNTPVVPWREGLTLTQAILEATYNASVDPATIVIRRNGNDIQIRPERLLSGGDFPLQRGDVIQITLPAQ